MFSGVFRAIVTGMTAESRRVQLTNQGTHSVTSTDGVTIAGTVHGHGPPLVFLHGVIGDGDLDWQALLVHMTGRFTCHLPSWRGRGLSGDHPDLRFGRLVDDILAYVDSIEGPTGLVGWSAGAGLALAAAGAQPHAVAAVAAVDPGMPGLMDTHEHAAFGDAVARMGELAAEDRLVDAVRAFAGFVFNGEEVAVAEDAGYLEATGRYAPTILDFFHQQMEHAGPTADDPAVLGAISVPVLVLVGSEAKPYATRAARYVTEHVSNARIHEIRGAGHAPLLTHPESLAEALVEFFTPAQQRA